MPDDSRRPEEPTEPPAAVAELEAEIEQLRNRLEDFERDVEKRTVDRSAVEADLNRYIRRRINTARARGWGPYLVLLYGTVMTLGAFYYLRGGWAILAMIVIWFSTLGVYVFMLVVGTGLSILGIPGRIGERIRQWRR